MKRGFVVLLSQELVGTMRGFALLSGQLVGSVVVRVLRCGDGQLRAG